MSPPELRGNRAPRARHADYSGGAFVGRPPDSLWTKGAYGMLTKRFIVPEVAVPSREKDGGGPLHGFERERMSRPKSGSLPKTGWEEWMFARI